MDKPKEKARATTTVIAISVCCKAFLVETNTAKILLLIHKQSNYN
ncbi:MAG: hypothetical protein WCS37_17845 [Chloroflexota bacterium]